MEPTMQIKNFSFIAILFFCCAANSFEISKFDIDGLRLRQTYEEIKNKYPCNQHYGPHLKHLQICRVNDNRRVHEKIIENEFQVIFGLSGQAMLISKTVSISSEQISDLKVNEVFKKFGTPIVSSEFLIRGKKIKAHCWGDCTPHGNSYKRWQNGGPTFNYMIKSLDEDVFQHESELYDLDLHKSYSDFLKANK